MDKIANISRESTKLINEGIEFDSGSPEYFYTQLDQLKVEMLAKATENAVHKVEETGGRVVFLAEEKD